jgi:hypothetical protein
VHDHVAVSRGFLFLMVEGKELHPLGELPRRGAVEELADR